MRHSSHDRGVVRITSAPGDGGARVIGSARTDLLNKRVQIGEWVTNFALIFKNEGRLQINAGYRIHDKGADLNSWRNTPPYNIRFYHSAYRRVAPHAIAPMAEIRQKVCAALVLAQKLKRPICWWRPLVKFS
jgi:hypothetical protein